MLFRHVDEPLIAGLLAASKDGYFDPRLVATDVMASGTPAGGMNLAIVLQARAPSQVVITDMRVVVDSRKPLLPGDYVTTPLDGCGGGVDPLFGTVNLDEPRAPLRLLRQPAEGGAAAPLSYPWALAVSQAESEVLYLTAYGLEGVTSWHLEIDHTAGGEQATMVIDDDGRPFVVAGIDPTTPRYDIIDRDVPEVARVPEKDGLLGSCESWPAEFPQGLGGEGLRMAV